MSQYIRTRRTAGASLVLAAALMLGACGGDSKKADSLAADSTLNRDLSLASKDSAAQPQLKDVPAPAATAPKKTASNPKPAPPRPAAKAPAPVTTPSGNTVTTTPAGKASGGGNVGAIAAGSTLALHSSSRVCTNTNAVGDKVTATTTDAVNGSNGAVIPAGATVTMTVTKLKRSENTNDPVVMEFSVNSIAFGGQTYQLDAEVSSAAIDRIKDEPKGKDIQKVVGGAVIGGIAGKILGKSTKGAVIGAAAGAAAGAGVAAATANYQGCIPEGGNIVVKLNSAAQVKV